MTDSTKKPPLEDLPKPAGKNREETLPWQHPKSTEDDPGAWERVRTIMQSPGYIVADKDPEFLERHDTRALRLGIDYLKPESIFREQGVEHTIVVFGSTRITEPALAKRSLEQARKRAELAPDDAEIQRRLKVAERILAKSHFYKIAQEFGQIVGRSGSGSQDTRICLMTGGGPGMMEAANRGAWDVGAKSIGLNIRLPHEQYPNPYIAPELCAQVHYFAIRKLHFLQRAKALVAFPGGYGTLDELFEALTLIQTRKIQPIPVVLVGESYWRKAIDIDFLVDEGVIDLEDRDLLWFAESAEEIWCGIEQWHKDAGEPIFQNQEQP